ncbi:MAG: hypothetical protein JXX28_12835 [Deltaproteobacteria bacterium]|nr:hypothetical protein [Deltaproteobacteria bacterium]
MTRPLGAAHAIAAALLFSAHLFRAGHLPAALATALFPLLLLWRTRWVLRTMQAAFLAASAEWLRTGLTLALDRASVGAPYLRMVFILGAVSGFTALGALLLERQRERYPRHDATIASLGAITVAAALLIPVQGFVRMDMVLLERFFPGGGWVELGLVLLYTGWIAERLVENSRLWRGRLWTLFSAVFFLQLLLGLGGLDRFLQTGQLHLPVPALIIAGPLYRGEGLFMPILFLSTIALAGPIWCSHLCYIGAWDHASSTAVSRPEVPGRWRPWGRVFTLALVVVGALTLRGLGVRTPIAAAAGGAFGLIGVAIMLLVSRKKGYMAHCTAWCPVGLVAITLGRLNPFRVTLGGSCTQCGACTPVCRYDALRPEHLAGGQVGSSCTLCGDCVQRCPRSQLQYRFLRWQGEGVRIAFVALAAALHAVFLTLARI